MSEIGILDLLPQVVAEVGTEECRHSTAHNI